MADITLTYQGTITVPLFEPAWTWNISGYGQVGSGWTFNSKSMAPQLAFQPIDNGTIGYKSLISLIPNITGPSVATLNPTAGGFHSLYQPQTWVNNRNTTLCNFPGGGVQFNLSFQPRDIGDWSSSITNNDFNGESSSDGALNQPFGFNDNAGFPYWGFMTLRGDGLTWTTWGRSFNPVSGGTIIGWQNVIPGNYPSGTQLWAGVGTWACWYDTSIFFPKNPINYFLIGPGVDRPSQPGPVLFTVTYPVGGSALFNLIQTVAFDNPTLDGIFNGGGTFDISCCTKGFLIMLLTNGTGPTGQRYEIALTSPDCTKYVLIKFAPFCDEAASQLAFSLGTWSVKPDLQGTFWFNNGERPNNPLFSFAIDFPPFPQPLHVDFPPTQLPCMDLCPPSY